MAEQENTPDEIAAWVAGLRGKARAKQEQDRELLEAMHRAEPEPTSDADAEAQEFLAKLFAPKAGEVEAIRRIHGSDASDQPVPGTGSPDFDVGPRGSQVDMPIPEPRPSPYEPSDEPGWGPEVEMDAEAMFPWLRDKDK
jgi:hypothetical protein